MYVIFHCEGIDLLGFTLNHSNHKKSRRPHPDCLVVYGKVKVSQNELLNHILYTLTKKFVSSFSELKVNLFQIHNIELLALSFTPTSHRPH